MCFKMAGCHQTLLNDCDAIVAVAHRNLDPTINNALYNGSVGGGSDTNPNMCAFPSSCEECVFFFGIARCARALTIAGRLFGSPQPDGSFVIDSNMYDKPSASLGAGAMREAAGAWCAFVVVSVTKIVVSWR